MCGSNKGQSQQNTNTAQSQTYAPNPQTIAALQSALGKAQGAASSPFNLPVAPVAGFSPDQLAAFDTVRGSQNIGQPYLSAAQNYYSPNGAQAFFNPAVGAVTEQMKNIFGQQDVQNTSNLVNAAGGVGADRIAVGQGNLANQQGLAAGATYANLWNSAVQQAQSAGAGQLATGNQAWGQAFQGANARLGTGGLQQQEEQAKLNAPYQWDVAAQAFPYQQSNFLTNATASLAPGFGGTTYGTGTNAGTTTPPQPSMWSQLLGAGVAGVGLYNGMGGASSPYNIFGSSPSYGGGNVWSGDASGGSSSNPLPGLTVQDYGAGFARGGDVDNPYHFDDGGTANPYGATMDTPIDISRASLTGGSLGGGSGQTPHIAPHIPQIDLSPPKTQQQSSSSSGPNFGDIAKTALQIGAMFAKDGGSVPSDRMRTFDGYDPYSFFESRFPKGYDGGGEVVPFPISIGEEMDNRQRLERALDHVRSMGIPESDIQRALAAQSAPVLLSPYANRASGGNIPRYDDGGDVEPYRLAGPAAMDTWRNATPLPDIITRGINPYMPASGNALVDTSRTPGIVAKEDKKARDDDDDDDQPSGTGYSPQVSENPNEGYNISIPEHRDRRTAIDNPWMALAQAGLGMMAGTSPYAGVNIGAGGMKGLQMLQQQREEARKDETADQGWRRLEQEAKQHADQYNRETLAQKNTRERAEWQDKIEMSKPIKLGTDKNGYDVMGVRDPSNLRRYLSPFTGEPIDPNIMMPGSGPGAPLPTMPGAPGVNAPGANPDGTPVTKANLPAGVWLANTEQAKQPYNYSEDAPYVEKGMEVPDPEPISGRSTRSIQQDAESYLQTGKLPPVARGRSPVAIAQQRYRDAVQNYGNAVATSRGVMPAELAEAWRTAPLMGRFILGPDGRATVSLGTAMRHLDTLKQYIDAFNASDIPTMRRLQATISREFGDTAATNIDAAASIVGPEIVKAIGVAGAGTEADRTHAMELFKGGSASAREAIQVVQRLLGGQLEGKERQATAAGLSREKFKSLIGDKQYDELRDLDKKLIGGAAQKTEGKTIKRTGTVTSGPNQGKTIIEYNDGSTEYR